MVGPTRSSKSIIRLPNVGLLGEMWKMLFPDPGPEVIIGDGKYELVKPIC